MHSQGVLVEEERLRDAMICVCRGVLWVWFRLNCVCLMRKKEEGKPMEKKDINSSQKISEELILYWNNV